MPTSAHQQNAIPLSNSNRVLMMGRETVFVGFPKPTLSLTNHTRIMSGVRGPDPLQKSLYIRFYRN